MLFIVSLDKWVHLHVNLGWSGGARCWSVLLASIKVEQWPIQKCHLGMASNKIAGGFN